MPKLKWDQTGERLYETGVDKVVLFPMESTGQYGAGDVYKSQMYA